MLSNHARSWGQGRGVHWRTSCQHWGGPSCQSSEPVLYSLSGQSGWTRVSLQGGFSISWTPTVGAPRQGLQGPRGAPAWTPESKLIASFTPHVTVRMLAFSLHVLTLPILCPKVTTPRGRGPAPASGGHRQAGSAHPTHPQRERGPLLQGELLPPSRPFP